MTPMRWVLLALTSALLGYEGMALWTTTKGDTISEVVWRLSEQYPILPFLGGVLAGHFFWPRRSTDVK